MVVTVVMRWFWVKAVVMVRVIMVMRTMVTVVVEEAVIGVTMAIAMVIIMVMLARVTVVREMVMTLA